MPPRRTHTKSRNGCAKCKRRRVKCDEVHPACGNCIKHAIECDFSTGGGGSINDNRASSTTSTASTITTHSAAAINTGNNSNNSNNNNSSLLSPPASTPDSYIGSPSPITTVRASPPDTLPLLQNHHRHHNSHHHHHHHHHHQQQQQQHHQQQQSSSQHLIPHTSAHPGISFSWATTDLELIYHFAMMVPTLASTQNRIDMWTNEVPRLAFADKSGCAVHAMLAVSSLHLAFVEPHNRTSRLITATAHYDQAVRTISAMVVPHICKDSCEALFVSSSLVVVFATASPLIHGNSAENEPWSIPEWFPLIRGVYSILREVWDWVEFGCLAPLLETRFYETPGFSKQEEETLNELYKLCTDTAEPDADEIKDTAVSSAYFSAIHELRKSFMSCTDLQMRSDTVSLVFRWPICLSDKYVSLLKQRRPRALVIFAYYCVLLKRMEEYWWVEGRAEYELVRIERSIRDPEKWQKWLEWPIKMVRKRAQVEILDNASSTTVAAVAADVSI